MALRAHNLAKHFILLTYLVTYFLILCLSVSSVSACLSVTPALSLSLHLFLFPLLFLPASQSLSACLSVCIIWGGEEVAWLISGYRIEVKGYSIEALLKLGEIPWDCTLLSILGSFCRWRIWRVFVSASTHRSTWLVWAVGALALAQTCAVLLPWMPVWIISLLQTALIVDLGILNLSA